MYACGASTFDCRLELNFGILNPLLCSGRPFARPDALRRHKEKGHCSVYDPKDPNEEDEEADPVPATSVGGLPLDPTWNERHSTTLDSTLR